jgi:hypothetical protein
VSALSRFGEAERLLGPAYWDDGDSTNAKTAIARLIEAPERHFSPLRATPHAIFETWLAYPGQHVGQLILGGELHRSRYPIDANTIRRSCAVLTPLTIDRDDHWRIGAVVRHHHGERAILDGKLAVCVDTVSAKITIAAQLIRWGRAYWWLLVRDIDRLVLLQRAICGGAWRHRSDILEAIPMINAVAPYAPRHVEI